MMRRLKLYFWIALIGHLLLFLSFSFVVSSKLSEIYQPYDASLKKKNYTVLPAFIYHEPPSVPKPPTPKPKVVKQKIPTSEHGIEKPAETLAESEPENDPSTPKEFSAKMQTDSSTADKTVDEPLLRLLYHATSEKLVYPKIARDFKVVGTVKVKFLVDPSGHLSQITLVKSSGLGFYDDAVMDAINAMSPVRNVNLYLKKPKYITAIINFI